MKRTSMMIALAALLTASVALPTFAAEKEKPAKKETGKKEITLTGEGKCAKCALHETDKCQNVVQVIENGKTNTYFLTQNKVSKDFHENLCKESKKISVTGKVHDEGGKHMITASKIQLATQ